VVSPLWTTVPAAGSTYKIIPGTTADRVYGQPDLSTNPSSCNNAASPINGLGPLSLCFPEAIALDSSDNLYVADTNNNRVLEYDGFVASGTSTGGNTSTTLNDTTKNFIPNQFVGFLVQIIKGTGIGQLGTITSNTNTQLTVSPSWITLPDNTSAYQILADTTADRVFGQPDFFSNAINEGNPGAAPPPNATSLFLPRGVAIDAAGNLYVGDTRNSRVLGYAPPLATGMSASTVFGQPDFVSNLCNNQNLPPDPPASIGGLNSRSLCFPEGVAVDSSGNLYIADTKNNRVLQFLPLP